MEILLTVEQHEQLQRASADRQIRAALATEPGSTDEELAAFVQAYSDDEFKADLFRILGEETAVRWFKAICEGIPVTIALKPKVLAAATWEMPR